MVRILGQRAEGARDLTASKGAGDWLGGQPTVRALALRPRYDPALRENIDREVDKHRYRM